MLNLRKERVMIIDSHTHTHFSMDSVADPEEHILFALDKKIDKIAFTDHVDRVDNSLDFYYDFDAYIDELSALKSRYAGKIDVLIGCEIGLNPSLNSIIEPIMDDARFDFFIGSLHTLNDADIASSVRHLNDGFSDYYDAYYRAMLEAVEKTEGFQILGHIDYLDRYLADKSMIPPFETYEDLLTEILKVAIKKDIAIEYNTGGFFRGLDYANPKDAILTRYRELGGRRICLSSDAHRSKDVARGFDEASIHLKDLGFDTITYFEQKRPREVPLG